MTVGAPPLSLVIDTDTASDDAVALLFAVLEPTVRVRAVTVVAGNVPLPAAVRNTLGTLALVDRRDVPVHAGLARPLVRPLHTAQDVHGEDGMAGHPVPVPDRTVDAEHAVDALRRIARDEPGVHTLVTLGPLSNVAAALLLDPDLLTLFRHTYLMAGAPDGRGNVTAVGEFNVWADPEAAAIVFAAEGSKTMVGWNVSRQYAVVSPEAHAAMDVPGTLGAFVAGINRKVVEFCDAITGLRGFDLPDPVTMAVALDPSIVTVSEPLHVSVSLDPTTLGQTFCDYRKVSDPPNMNVVWGVDADAFTKRLNTVCAHVVRSAADGVA